MSNSTTYTAITVGPIIETLQLTSKPAGLWAASYLFSEVSRQICERLPKENIVSPFFENGEYCGAGLFPDRIILKIKDMLFETLDDIIINAKKAVAAAFGIDEDYLSDYLQVHVIKFETDGNPIKELSPLIAMMENERYYKTNEQENKLLNVFEQKESSDESACAKVKGCKLVQDLKEKWPLWADKPGGEIRSLYHIASNNKVSFQDKGTAEQKAVFSSLWKKHRYYAVIQADGDNVGTHITNLAADEITDFSKKCWNYSKQADSIVRCFGGVTIYAGGDDLLAIVPIENNQCETVFDLVKDIRKKFKEIFGTVGSLSFGIAVRFHKYPLYEAIHAAQSLLFGKAKQVYGKNTIAINLQKHSGKSIGLLFPSGSENECLDELDMQIKTLIKTKESDRITQEIGDLIHSLQSHLFTYRRVFIVAIEQEKTEQVFKNIFNEKIYEDHPQIKNTIKLLRLCRDECMCQTEKDKKCEPLENALLRLDALLCIIKFFIEPIKEGDIRG
jgi:CRISPR-associated protein Cmr2